MSQFTPLTMGSVDTPALEVFTVTTGLCPYRSLLVKGIVNC